MDTYADLVRRLCLVRLKSREDTEDIFQTVFLKYLQHTKPFANAEHEKAWFIQVTLNACRDLLRFWARRPTVPLEALAAQAAPEPEDRTVPGGGVSPLLRGLLRPGDRGSAGQKPQHGVHPPHQGPGPAAGEAGR